MCEQVVCEQVVCGGGRPGGGGGGEGGGGSTRERTTKNKNPTKMRGINDYDAMIHVVHIIRCILFTPDHGSSPEAARSS